MLFVLVPVASKDVLGMFAVVIYRFIILGVGVIGSRSKTDQ